MTELKIGKPLRGGSPAGGETGFVELDTESETHRLVFTDEVAENLILALRQVQGAIQAERLKVGKTALQHRYLAEIERFEFLVDQINQVAVIRTRYKSGSSQDLAIERKLIPEVVQFLNKTIADFEDQSKSQPQ
jgi:hypothetical protein